MKSVRLLLLVAGVAIALMEAPASAADTRQEPPPGPLEGCIRRDIYGTCIKVAPVPVSGSSPSESGTDEPDDGGSSAPPPDCRWRSLRSSPMYEQILGPPPLDMANPVMQWFGCDELSYLDGGLGTPVGFRWVDAGVAPPPGPPPAEAISAGLFVQVQALMVGPVVVTDPPETARWIVQLPVFVEVTNWQGELVDGACVAGLCVTMTAVPSLEFDPGERGSPVVGCTPPGTRWNRAGGSPLEQAVAPGACAWRYQLRSGVDGRPEQWPASVTVRWSVNWSASDGSSGSFPELAFSTGIPQAVEEVQTVVVDDE